MSRDLIIKWIVLFVVLLEFRCEAELNSIQRVDIQPLKIEECLLPEDHPLQSQLKGLFKKSKMFQSESHWEKAGFKTLKKRTHTCLMVASHPTIDNYLFKKHKDEISQDEQIQEYLNRISAARALKKFIRLNDLQHIVVPQKWLYKLPQRLSHPPKSSKPSYILIVEKMDICQGGNNPHGEVAIRYSNIDFSILNELCIVLYYFRGLDSSLKNMPFTHQNKIAFVDTEKGWDVNREGFLQRVMSYLSQDRQAYARSIFEELQAQGASIFGNAPRE